MFCPTCKGFLNVVKVHEPPAHLTKEQKLVYQRTCDVECMDCGQVLYAQPYDFGNRLNAIPEKSNDIS